MQASAGPAGEEGKDLSAPPEPKYRYQFFQTQAIVEVAVLAKNLTSEHVRVDIEERFLGVQIFDASGEQVRLGDLLLPSLMLTYWYLSCKNLPTRQISGKHRLYKPYLQLSVIQGPWSKSQNLKRMIMPTNDSSGCIAQRRHHFTV